VRRRRATSQRTYNVTGDTHTDAHPRTYRSQVPTDVALLTLSRVEELRTEIKMLTTSNVPRHNIDLLRACIATVVLFLFFSRCDAGIECFNFDLATTHRGVIIMYHRDRKGQRGVATKHRLLCSIPGSAHRRIAMLPNFSDSYRLRRASTDKASSHCIVSRGSTTATSI
jgi:hypothetical protein